MNVQSKEREWWLWETLVVEEQIARREKSYEYTI